MSNPEIASEFILTRYPGRLELSAGSPNGLLVIPEHVMTVAVMARKVIESAVRLSEDGFLLPPPPLDVEDKQKQPDSVVVLEAVDAAGALLSYLAASKDGMIAIEVSDSGIPLSLRNSLRERGPEILGEDEATRLDEFLQDSKPDQTDYPTSHGYL